jgi:tungstate transport system ATP-binding protein
MSGPLLQARGIKFSRPDGFSLDVPAFELGAEESVALIGPNGAGKSTLLKVLAGLEAAQGGEIVFGGAPVRGGCAMRAYHRRTAYVPQSVTLYNTTVFENVAVGLKIRGMAKDDRRERVMAMLKRFGIEGLSKRSAHKVSGGEARRVMLARALVLRPEALFMDEPFGELDLPVKEEIIADLTGALAELKCAKVVVTHDHDEALRLGGRFAVMVKGRIVQSGAAADVFNLPATADVAAFVGVRNVVAGEVVSSEAGTSLVRLGAGGAVLTVAGEFPQGRRVTACIPPESVVLVPAGKEAGGVSARNVLRGRVTGLMPFRYGQWVRLDCGFSLSVCVTSQAVSSLEIAIGSELDALIKATAVHVIAR